MHYPPARRGETVDRLHGVDVPDPYRWLEETDTSETQAWIEAQNALVLSYLEATPGREAIRRRLSELWDHEKYGLVSLPVPIRRGGRTFYAYNDGLRNQSLIYWSERLGEDPTAGAHLLIDPNSLSSDGTVALIDLAPSHDGRLVAYGLSEAGSDWIEWRVRDVDGDRDLPDRVQWSKFSVAAWTRDGQGFFYSRYEEPAPGQSYKSANYHQRLCYHRIGTPQSEDRLIYARPDHPEWGFGAQVTEDGRYLIIQVWRGTHRVNGLFYLDLAQTGVTKPVELLADFDAGYQFLGNDGERLYVRTDLDAPLGRVVAIDLARPERAAWREVLPEGRDALATVERVADRLVVVRLRDACSRVAIHDLEGRKLTDVVLPGLGTAAGFYGTCAEAETFFLFVTFTAPPTLHRLDVATGRSELQWRPRGGFDPGAFETHQIFYESRDGTSVPLFLCHRRGLELDGDRPVHLFGYGGFNNPAMPQFSVPVYVWMEMGGVYAQACLRGGGEYGREWHEAGTKLRKQNVFDDFVAAAEWLVTQRYTRPERLSIGGRSNGGLLVGACLTQRPDLFAACLPAVGVLDMLRFHKFTIGWAWTSDYGSPEVAEEFRALLAYSPYHNVRPGTAYPAVFLTTADHDDRVFPAHSYKFAAALQAAQSGQAPILIRVDQRAGHGFGKPTTLQIEESADRWAFLCRELGLPISGV